MQASRYFPLTLIVVAIISGCSTVSNQSLKDANSNYNNARSNPDVTNLAAPELKHAISRADKSAPVLNGIERPMGQSNKEGIIMKGFVQDIEDLAVKNDEFRRVIYTAKHCQLVLMALKPKEEIGAEVHKLDQFFRVEEGAGEAVLDGVRTAIRAGFAVVVPAWTKHNIINTGSVPLKLYTLSNSHYDQNLADSRLGRANDLTFGCISPTFQHKIEQVLPAIKAQVRRKGLHIVEQTFA